MVETLRIHHQQNHQLSLTIPLTCWRNVSNTQAEEPEQKDDGFNLGTISDSRVSIGHDKDDPV